MSRWRAIEAWQRSYDDPIAVTKGQRIKVGARDEDWPQFLWCSEIDGEKRGWIPEAVLVVQEGEAEVLEDYNCLELTVIAGELVAGGRSLAGWILCRNAEGEEGWVPEKVLIPAS